MLAAACFGAGLMSFELISFHLSISGTVSGFLDSHLRLHRHASWAIAASLILGRLYDRIGLPVVLAAIAIASLFSPLVFLGGFYVALFGMMLWGLGYAVQDTLAQGTRRRNVAGRPT